MKGSNASSKFEQLYRALREIDLDSFEGKLSMFNQFYTIEKNLYADVDENTTNYTISFNHSKRDNNWFEYAQINDSVMKMNAEDILDCVTKVSRNGAVNQAILDKFGEDINSNLNSCKQNETINILITDFERYGSGLMSFIKSLENNHNNKYMFTLATDNHLVSQMFENVFAGYKNIKVQYFDIRSLNKPFHAVLMLDHYIRTMWGVRENNRGTHNSKTLYSLFIKLMEDSNKPKLFSVVVPVGFFCSNRREIVEARVDVSKSGTLSEASILPDHLFRWTSIKLALLSLGSFGGYKKQVLIRDYALKNEKLIPEHETTKDLEEFLLSAESSNGWNLPVILLQSDKSVEKLLGETKRIGDEAVIFRGRHIPRPNSINDSSTGSIKVINISNMTDAGIDTSECEAIACTKSEEKFFLRPGDLLLATRGTVVKTSVFDKEGTFVASSNITVIRPNTNTLNGWFLKIFFDSPLGKKMLNGLKRGTLISNISSRDVEELRIPIPDIKSQEKIVDKYRKGLELYNKTISDAISFWKKLQDDIFNNLYKQGE